MTVNVDRDHKGRILRHTEQRVSPPRPKARSEEKILRYHAAVFYYLFRAHSFERNDGQLIRFQPREVQVMRYKVVDEDARYFFATNNNHARQIQEIFCTQDAGEYLINPVTQLKIILKQLEIISIVLGVLTRC